MSSIAELDHRQRQADLAMLRREYEKVRNETAPSLIWLAGYIHGEIERLEAAEGQYARRNLHTRTG